MRNDWIGDVVLWTFGSLCAIAVAAAVLPNVSRHADRARETKTRADIASFQSALTMYKADVGDFPATEQGLAALHARPAGVAGWAGPYIRQDVPKDAWGRDYVYKYPGQVSRQR